MKIIQINSVCGTGSTGKLAVQISDYLNGKNIENYIAYGYGKSKRANTFKFGNMIDAHLHSFISRKFCMQGYGSVLPTFKLLRFIRKVDPDIIHLHNIHGHYLNFKILFRFLKKTHIKVIWTFHDCWPMTGKCTHFSAVHCERWMIQCCDCPQLNTYPDSEKDRSKKNYIEKKQVFTSIKDLHIVAVSKWLKSIAEHSFFRGKDIRYIYNGINIDMFKKGTSSLCKQYRLNDKYIILGVASVWNERKGFSQFLQLARIISEDCRIILIGLSEKQCNNLPENIIGIRSVQDQRKLAEYYQIADVFVNLSAEETFGLVVAEALACGTPAIVLNSTACPEIIDKNTGIVIDNLYPETVWSAVQQIRSKGKNYYQEACIQRVSQMFTIERMQEEYFELYSELEKKSD